MGVVIVGSEGFIGRELKTECTAAGLAVTSIDTVPSTSGGRHVLLDARSPELPSAIPAGTEVVVHLAAVSRDADCAANPVGAVELNVAGALEVFQAAKAAGVQQLVFASSEWVYGDVAGQHAQTEELAVDAARLTSEYALTKLFAERLLYAAWAREPSIAVTVLRFSIVYGPRPANWSAVEQLFHQVRERGRVEVGSASTARRFIHVKDIARGILSALGQTGYEVFNISGDRLITLRDIVQESAAILHQPGELLERNPAATTVRNPSNEKAKRVLRWQPMVDLSTGLRSLL